VRSIKEVLTDWDLPYLLSEGEIFENVNNNLTRTLYNPAILIGDNMIEKRNNSHIINNSKSNILTYRFTFSRGVNFSLPIDLLFQEA